MRESVPFGAIPTAEVLGITGRSNGAALSDDIARVINWINMLYNCLVKVLGLQKSLVGRTLYLFLRKKGVPRLRNQ